MEINKWVEVPTVDKFKHEVNNQNTFAYTTNCKRIINGVEDEEKFYAKVTFSRAKMTSQIVIFDKDNKGVYIDPRKGLVNIQGKITYFVGQESNTNELMSVTSVIDDNSLKHEEDSYFIKFLTKELPSKPINFTFRIVVDLKQSEKFIEYIFEINNSL